MKTKIALSLMAIVMATAMIVSGTMAYFTDHDVSDTATIKSGKLALAVTGGTNTITGLVPGGAASEAIVFTIKNTGDMDLAWLGNIKLSGNNDLLDKLYVDDWKMEFFNSNDTTWYDEDHWIVNGAPDARTAGLTDTATDGKVSLRKFVDAAVNNGMNFGPYVFGGSLKKDCYYRMTIKVGLASSATNIAMDKTAYLGFETDATQINWQAMQQYIPFFNADGYTAWFTNNLANQH